jgi:hypothetical protein
MVAELKTELKEVKRSKGKISEAVHEIGNVVHAIEEQQFIYR